MNVTSQTVAQEFELGKTLQLAGLNDSAKVFLVSTHNAFQQKVILWFCESDEKAQELYYHARFWKHYFKTDANVAVMPSLKEQKLSGQIVSKDAAQEQRFLYQLHHRDAGIYFVPIQMVGSKVAQTRFFHEDLTHVAVGENVVRQDFLSGLTSRGYEPETKVFEPGTFAVRGSIVDLFVPQYDHPVRVEWDGEKIASIRGFDPAKSTRGKQYELCEIPPFKVEHKTTLWDHFDNGDVVILDNPEHLTQNFNIFSLSDNERGFERFLKRFAEQSQVTFELFPSHDVSNQVVFDFQNPASYRGNVPFFLEDLKKYLSEKYKIWIVSQSNAALRKEAIKAKLPVGRLHFVDDLPNHTITPQKIRNELFGFIGRKEKIAFFTDKEIFGIENVFKNGVHKATPRSTTIIAELKPGDYVVHVDHGIARFLGTQTNVIDEIPKEYFVLEYAENDRLYLPVEFAEKISKYIGRENPTINKLGASAWNQTKRVVQKKAELLASDLLKLYAARATIKSASFAPAPELENAFSERFAYDLTPDQQQAVQEILADLEKPTPMDRLLVGDVGFGKTEVAMRIALRVAANGYQVVFLAPTTILVDQHMANFQKRFKGLPITVDGLSRFRDKKDIATVLTKLATGEIDIIIGTHRLLSKDVKFKKPGLLIVDEEQRFGVKQKEKLKALRNNMHVLSLSATPIPRTLNLSLAGVRDFSVILTPPQGRLPIETYIEPYSDQTIDTAIRREIERGGQVYVLHNRIETIDAVRNRLQQKFPDAPADIAHGQMEEDVLEKIMEKFYSGYTKILVCSTIIENGIDLPTVNTLIVDRADQFGLAQLYQLRGRIGRGNQKAYAYFLYRNRRLSSEAKDRLQALLESTELGSGFKLAMRDLEIRGAGNILGAEQSGNIAAVGLNLYLRLLHQAVEEQKTGSPQQAVLDVTIDLPLPAFLPQDFFENEQERLQTYQLMAQIENFAELDRFTARLEKDRFHIPEPMKNLMDVLELKLLMQQARIIGAKSSRALREDGQETRRVILEFAEVIDPQHIQKLLDRNAQWQFTTQLIKINLEHLGKAWMQELKEVVRLFISADKLAKIEKERKEAVTSVA